MKVRFIEVKLTGADGSVTDFLIDECNERGAVLLGLTKSAMAGAPLSSFCSTDERLTVLKLFARAMKQGFYEDEFSRLNADGHRTWLNRRLVRSGNGLALTLRDITESKKHQAELYRMANCDALTGLYNRHWMMRFLPGALERVAQNGKQMALLFVDLDNFKEVNNSLGHGAGDQLLVLAAQRFRELVRPLDQVVRLGGDEFTIILEGVGRGEIADIADRIITGFTMPFSLGQRQVDSVRASIGIAICPDDGVNVDMLVQHADSAMYLAKKAGKAHYRFYHAEAAGEAIA